MRTIVMCRVDGRSDYGATIILSEGYEHFVGERKEFIHSKEGNFQRYLCYWEKSPYGWDRCENYYFEPNFPVPVTAGTAALSMYHQDGSPTVWPYKMVKAELRHLK